MARDISNNARLALAQDAVFAPAGNALGVPEGTIVCRSSLTDPDNGCIPFNRLGIGTASQEARDWVLGTPFRPHKFQQDVFPATLSFSPFHLPPGPSWVAIRACPRPPPWSGQAPPES